AKLFVEAYMANGENGTQAAIDIGLSPKSAHVLASRLLKDVKVRELLGERRAALQRQFQFGPEDVLRSLKQAVTFDPRKLYNADGTMKAPHELDENTAMALAGLETVEVVGIRPHAKAMLEALKRGEDPADVDVVVDVEEELEGQPHGGALLRKHARAALYTNKVKWLDKNTARDQAMKHFGLYERDNAQRGDPAIIALLEAVAEGAATIKTRP
ncbi:MAG TPA: terminase small subunit, partial [Burkholderiales bacterium]|nr:terminase small subunit [Burkholderiales bacterium]